VNDVAFRIMIVLQIIWQLQSIILDVEAAFLNGDLEEVIYMECPLGMEHEDDEVLLLKKLLYGLVQSARQFFKKYSTILKKIGFTQSYAEHVIMRKALRFLQYMLMIVISLGAKTH
jgi:Reverse transcriptase (RNA-dependent DNA polymerase)